MTDATQLDRIEAKLDRLQASFDRTGSTLELLPDLIATFGNTVDDLAARDGNANFDARMRGGVSLLVRLGDPALLAALERLLDPHTLALLADAAVELPPAAAAPGERLGIVGLLGALRDDDAQRATSFLMHYLRRLGRALGERDRQQPQESP
jgi:hypothetical protein